MNTRHDLENQVCASPLRHVWPRAVLQRPAQRPPEELEPKPIPASFRDQWRTARWARRERGCRKPLASQRPWGPPGAPTRTCPAT